jgi:hypothetical protein
MIRSTDHRRTRTNKDPGATIASSPPSSTTALVLMLDFQGVPKGGCGGSNKDAKGGRVILAGKQQRSYSHHDEGRHQMQLHL